MAARSTRSQRKAVKTEVHVAEQEIKVEIDAIMVEASRDRHQMAAKTRQKRAKINVEYEYTAPKNWEKHFENIKEMRRDRNAPVDHLGCEVLADTAVPQNIQRFHVLVALMLSSQTKDEQTAAATRRLQALQGGLTPQNMIDLPEATIAQAIYGVGFWRRKAQYLKGASAMIIKDFGGDIPKTLKELCKLPGVGMKMAQIAMAVANKEITGIGIDTHCHRIMNRMGWCKTETAEQTRVWVEGWLPKSYWSEVNILLVGFGQQLCTPRNPKCEKCLNKDICPSSTAKRRSQKEPKVEIKTEE